MNFFKGLSLIGVGAVTLVLLKGHAGGQQALLPETLLESRGFGLSGQISKGKSERDAYAGSRPFELSCSTGNRADKRSMTLGGYVEETATGLKFSNDPQAVSWRISAMLAVQPVAGQIAYGTDSYQRSDSRGELIWIKTPYARSFARVGRHELSGHELTASERKIALEASRIILSRLEGRMQNETVSTTVNARPLSGRRVTAGAAVYVELDDWANAAGWTTSVSEDGFTVTLTRGSQTAKLYLASSQVDFGSETRGLGGILADRYGDLLVPVEGMRFLEGEEPRRQTKNTP